MISLRHYQTEAIEAAIRYWDGGPGNPLVDLATGLGKSVVIAKLTQRLLSEFPDLRILMLVHVRELVDQNYRALLRAWPSAPVGVYSAGLGKRETHHRITFASIQSVYKKAHVLGRRDLVLIDEAHLVPNAGAGMYRRLLNDLAELPDADVRVCGFTATPFRLDSGRLDGGEDRIFDKTVYSFGIGKGIEGGWLAPLISKASAAEIDVSQVQRRGGEFVAGSLEEAAMDDDLIRRAVDETIRFGQDRRSWLLFCCGIKHAFRVRDAMRSRGIAAQTVTGDTPAGERDAIIRDFKSGRIRCLTNANVLTTGFDSPGVDLVAMLRPTLSTGLYVQIVGRGTRPVWPADFQPDRATAEERRDCIAHSLKPNCLILDFAGNVRRHGPVDTVDVAPKKKRNGQEEEEGKVAVGDVRAKECPSCHSLVAKTATVCPHCDHEWPAEKKEPSHDAEADGESAIISSEPIRPTQAPVIEWSFRIWSKPDKPDSIRVDYVAGIQSIPEWVCPAHGGYAGQKAERWWRAHGGNVPSPTSAGEFIQRIDELTMPATIAVKPRGSFFDVVGRSFPRQEAAE